MSQKTAYICGPLTDLAPKDHDRIKGFYSNLADVCAEVPGGVRGFAPHEHYDPVRFAHFTPIQIDAAERDQVMNKTSVVIAVYVAPSWGSGIEVEMARQSHVPVVILCPKGKKVSRLLAGNYAVADILFYDDEGDALQKIREWLVNNADLLKP